MGRESRMILNDIKQLALSPQSRAKITRTFKLAGLKCFIMYKIFKLPADAVYSIRKMKIELELKPVCYYKSYY